TEKLVLTLDLHEFYTANRIATAEDGPAGTATPGRRLGTEVDFLVNYSLFKNVQLEAGYATIFATDRLNLLKAPATPKQDRGQWAYLMLNFTPDFLVKAEKSK
ncbi:MAG TPA: hypothetical protein VIG72_11440, partial [Pontibacter sp.]